MNVPVNVPLFFMAFTRVADRNAAAATNNTIRMPMPILMKQIIPAFLLFFMLFLSCPLELLRPLAACGALSSRQQELLSKLWTLETADLCGVPGTSYQVPGTVPGSFDSLVCGYQVLHTADLLLLVEIKSTTW